MSFKSDHSRSRGASVLSAESNVLPLLGSRSSLEHLARAPMPTQWGMFDTHVFRWKGSDVAMGLSDQHLALVAGDVHGACDVPTRVHSECLTGEVFGSLKCDCRQQLEWALAEIARRGRGVILYLRQEGRGIGLANKIRAYALQAVGADTVEANELLHLPVDARRYDVAAEMLRALGIRSVVLLTNNPDKVEQLVRLGVKVDARVPVIVDANPLSAGYLETKRLRMRHDLPEPQSSGATRRLAG